MDVEPRPSSAWYERVRLAALLTGTIVVFLVAMTILYGSNRHLHLDTWWFGNTVLALGLGAYGWLLARKVPQNPIGWLMLAAALANSSMGLAREWAVAATLGGHALPGATLAGWWGTWPYVISLATLPAILLVFPDGRLPGPRWRAVAVLLGSSTVMGLVEVMFFPGPFSDDLPMLVNPVGSDWVGLTVLGVLGRAGLGICIIAAVASLVVRTRRADAETRQQLRWVVLGASVLGIEVFLEIVPWPGDHTFFSWAGPLAVALFLGCLAVAVLRFRLWDLKLLLRMSLVYGILIAIITAVYVAVVAGFGAMADEQVAIGPSLVAAALGAAVFAFLRDRVQRVVERAFYGDRSDPYRALSKLGRRLDQPVSADSVLDEVVDAVAQSLRLGRVALVIPDVGEVAVVGHAEGPSRSLPLVFRDSEVGELVVTARPGSRLGGSELTILADLARPVAAVVHAVSVGEELQRSRRELVTAREAERRRVRRDLHDGLGPALAAVRMKLDSASILIDSDPERARVVIDQLTIDIRSTIADIRRLVHDLQPPELDEVGLVQALADRARSFSGPLEDGQLLQVDLRCPARIDGLPAAVEVAAYRIACEALANVARHSHASFCRVDVTLNGDLGLRIADNGIGLAPNVSRGLGTASMAERAAELGGTFHLGASSLGGVEVVAHLPVAYDDSTTRALRPMSRSTT